MLGAPLPGSWEEAGSPRAQGSWGVWVQHKAHDGDSMGKGPGADPPRDPPSRAAKLPPPSTITAQTKQELSQGAGRGGLHINVCLTSTASWLQPPRAATQKSWHVLGTPQCNHPYAVPLPTAAISAPTKPSRQLPAASSAARCRGRAFPPVGVRAGRAVRWMQPAGMHSAPLCHIGASLEAGGDRPPATSILLPPSCRLGQAGVAGRARCTREERVSVKGGKERKV